MNCRHCGQTLATITWSDGPGWTHGRLATPSYARECPQGTTYAEPEDAAADVAAPETVDLFGALVGAIDRARKARREDFTLSPPAIPQPVERRYEETLSEDETHD